VLIKSLRSYRGIELAIANALWVDIGSIDFSSQLKESLTQMGMAIAFEYPGADFSPLGSSFFFIGEVIHKTRLEVDEEGTVAAAATAEMVCLGSMMPRPRKTRTLVFDRPFAVLLIDTATGTTLFAGVIYEP
jgi:serine protease inhibitor